MVVLKSIEYLFNVCDITRITSFVSILFASILASSKLFNSRTKILRNGKQQSSKFFVLFHKKK